MRLRFRPDASGDGRVETETWHEDLPPADSVEALRLLKRINLSTTPAGERLASLVTVDGFEPWWFVQDRLFRFALVPLTRFLPLLARLDGAGQVQLIDAPAEARRGAAPPGGRAGVPALPFPRRPAPRRLAFPPGCRLVRPHGSAPGFERGRRLVPPGAQRYGPLHY